MSGFTDFLNRLTLNIFDSSDRQKNIDRWNEENNQRAWLAMQHQFDYDKWTQDFAERQFSYGQEMDEKQYGLATSPVSTLVRDAAKVGINPMAAMGQSIGSVSASSVGIPSSSAQNAQQSVPSSPGNSLASGLGLLASIVMENKRLNQQDKQFDKELEYRYQQLEQTNEVRRELGSARAALDALDLSYLTKTGSSRNENEYLRGAKELFTFVFGGRLPDGKEINDKLSDLPSEERKSLREAAEDWLENNIQQPFESWLDSHPRLRKGVDKVRKFLNGR